MWIAAGIIAAALVFILFQGSKNLTQYYMTIPQFTAKEASLTGKSVRISGTLIGSSVHYNDKTGVLSFAIEGGGRRVTVHYDKLPPDDFKTDVQAIIDGHLTASHVFVANQVMVRCPSHYGPAPAGGTSGRSA